MLKTRNKKLIPSYLMTNPNSEIEIINGVESARSIFKNSCSCGINYGDNKTQYKKHLEQFHIVKDGELING